jgi:non-ribosomal peptide synthetase component F
MLLLWFIPRGAVSYRELDYQANRVAIHLRSPGVGPDVPFGNRVQRSVDMVVGLVGILKAGKTGDKSECLAYIKSFWTDVRPLSLRKKMSEASAQDSAS